jgi:hypothetical protein
MDEWLDSAERLVTLAELVELLGISRFGPFSQLGPKVELWLGTMPKPQAPANTNSTCVPIHQPTEAVVLSD